MCVGFFRRGSVLARLPFDVLGHPLSSRCRLSPSSCSHNHRGCLLVGHLFMPCGFIRLCVSSLCSTPARVAAALCSPLLLPSTVLHCHFFFFFFPLPFSLIDLVKKYIYRAHYKSGQNNFLKPAALLCELLTTSPFFSQQSSRSGSHWR